MSVGLVLGLLLIQISLLLFVGFSFRSQKSFKMNLEVGGEDLTFSEGEQFTEGLQVIGNTEGVSNFV